MLLSPLQSRLAASLLASLLVLFFYFLVCEPKFAFAAELDAGSSGHDAIPFNLLERDQQRSDYEPHFPLFDRSIIGRAPLSFTSTTNNVPRNVNVPINDTVVFMFAASSVTSRTSSGSSELRRRTETGQETDDKDIENKELKPDLTMEDEVALLRRQSSRTLYISANTCQQPSRIGNGNVAAVPQLVLYVSNSTNNVSPGPDQSPDTQTSIVFNEGAVVYNTTLQGDVYFSVYAPNIAVDQFDATASPYNIQIAASVDQPYHSYANDQRADLVWIDSDASAVLLTTKNVTSDPSDKLSAPPYIMFAQNEGDLTINGMRNSYCGLSKWAQMRQLYDGQSSIKTGLRMDLATNLMKQEFYLDGLNASSKYVGFLATYQDPGSKRDVPGGGGDVLRQTEFQTKPAGACTVIFNLTLCDDLQYAAPGNATNFPDSTSLASFYDNYTQSMYANFEKALAQVACDAPPEGQWSLVKTCDDCRKAYKDWLCSVAIPRCEDFSSSNRPNLQMRNINAPFANGSFVDDATRNQYSNLLAFNSSRIPEIDEQVQPGPYKELLPCDDVCYNLFQSCPAAMGFGCPVPNSIGFNTSYGVRNPDGSLSCNFQGSANIIPSTATPREPSAAWAALCVVLCVAMVLLD